MNNKVRVAIIGAGEMGIIRGIIASAHTKFELTCFVDPNLMQVRIAGKQLGVPYYSNFAKAIKNENFDMAFICSPVGTHEVIACEAIEKRKHVFCEKPLSHSRMSSQRMLRIAQDAGVIHFMGFDQRYLPTFLKMREIIDRGILGKLIYIRSTVYHSEVIEPEKRKEVTDRQGRLGFYGSLGAHMLDLLLWYAGPLKMLQAQTTRNFSSKLDDYITAVCRFKNGMHGLVDFSWSFHGYDNKPEFSLIISGTEGTVTVDRDHINIFCLKNNDEFKAGEHEIFASEIQPPAEFMLTQRGISWEMDAIADAVLNNKNNYPTWQIGYDVDEFIEAISKSATTRQPVNLPMENEE